MKRVPPPPIHWPGRDKSGPAGQLVQQRSATSPVSGPRPASPPLVSVPTAVLQRKSAVGRADREARLPGTAPVVSIPSVVIGGRSALPGAPPSASPPVQRSSVAPWAPLRAVAIQPMKRAREKEKIPSEDESSESEESSDEVWTAVLDASSLPGKALREMNKRMGRGAVPRPALNAIQTIITAAIAGGGAGTASQGLQILETIMASAAVRKAKPPNSEGTYAIGLEGTDVISTGSGAFERAVAEELLANHPELTHVPLGSRESFTHGEITILKARPTVTAVLASQLCCVFCYGYLRNKNIANPGIRPSPYPKGWDHPVHDISLRQANYQTAKYGAFVWISLTDKDNPKFYRVE